MSMKLADAEGNGPELTLPEGVEMDPEATKTVVHIEVPGTTDEELAEGVTGAAGHQLTYGPQDSGNQGVPGAVGLQCNTGPQGPIVLETQKDTTPPTAEPAKVIEPANDAEEGEVEDEVEMSDDEFAVANVAKSIMDAGHYIAADKSAEMVFDGLTKVAKINDKDHSHTVVIQILDSGVVAGYTYATIGDGVEEHDHSIEGSFFDAEKKLLSGTTRSAVPTSKKMSAGPDHTHEFEITALVEDLLTNDQIQEVVGKLTALDDAKLSAERRSKLKGSTFCGPNRSFPVPDCAHVTAARRLIGRAKGSPQSKSRILSCVSRKAKALGCGGKKDSEETQPVQQAVVPPVVAEAAVSGKTGAQGGGDCLTPGSTGIVGQAVKQIEAAREAELLAEIALLKKDGEAQKVVVDEKEQKIRFLSDSFARMTAERNQDLAKTVFIMKMILKKTDVAGIKDREQMTEVLKTLASRTAESLRDTIADLLPEVDLAIRNAAGNIHRPLLTEPRPEPKVSKAQDRTNQPINKTKAPPTNQTAGPAALANDLRETR
jgi:hypothetical protein